jgi:hypothetical protein
MSDKNDIKDGRMSLEAALILAQGLIAELSDYGPRDQAKALNIISGYLAAVAAERGEP